MGLFDKKSREQKKIEKDTKKYIKNLKTDEEYGEALDDNVKTKATRFPHKQRVEENTANNETIRKWMQEDDMHKAISEAREKLFIDRNDLINRITRSNNEFRYLQTQVESPNRDRAMERCATTSKNAFYALALVEDAIERLDRVPDEIEWHNIIKDLTNGYKTCDAISNGADVMTRLAFLVRKMKAETKQDVSIHAMERYFGKPINQLLAEENLAGPLDENGNEMAAGPASQFLVKDNSLDLSDRDAIMDAVRWGTIYNVRPSDIAHNVPVDEIPTPKPSMPNIMAPSTNFDTPAEPSTPEATIPPSWTNPNSLKH